MSGARARESYVSPCACPAIQPVLAGCSGKKPEGRAGVPHPPARAQGVETGVDVVRKEIGDEERAPVH
eukprot:551906-Lingulodinium_polyedra.AAC.1